jgi:hypothetical protein
MNTLIIRRQARILVPLVLVSFVVACEQRAAETRGESIQMVSAPAEGSVAGDQAKSGVAPPRFQAVAVSRSAQAPVAAQLPAVSAPSMVIRNGAASVQVDSLEAAVDGVQRLATSLGGYVGNVSMQTGEHQVRSATLELKIPAARFDDAMAGMRPLGKLENSTATAQDVGEEFVDISARVANAKRLESRLVTLLATRTGKLEDVLAVERELARVREEIERYEGRIRYLSSRVAISTIVATVHEKVPIIASQPGTNVFAAAFLNMWRNFVGFLATGIELAGVLVPAAAIAWLVAIGWRRWRRTRTAPPVAA